MQKGDNATPATRPRPTRAQKFMRLACRAYLTFILCVWALVAFGADRWWLGTAAMFAPTWIWSLPLILLLPLAAILNRKALLSLAIAVLLILFPIARLCLPWRSLLPAPGGSQVPIPIKVITLNADHKDLDPKSLAKLIDELKPDLVLLQAWRSRYEKTVFADGWHIHREDELCLASRFPIRSTRRCDGAEFPEFRDHPGTLALYEVAAPAGSIHILNLHLATARDGLAALLNRALRTGAADLSSNTRIRRGQSLEAKRLFTDLKGPDIVAGDFNTPTTSAAYREYWSDLTNAFSQSGWGFGHTHFTSHTAVRIDHILLGPGWRVDACRVGPNVGSAHRPVIADVVWIGP